MAKQRDVECGEYGEQEGLVKVVCDLFGGEKGVCFMPHLHSVFVNVPYSKAPIIIDYSEKSIVARDLHMTDDAKRLEVELSKRLGEKYTIDFYL